MTPKCEASAVNGLPSMNSHFQMPTLRRILNGKGTSWSRGLPATGGKRLQIGKEVADVVDRRMLVGRIWKCREVMLAVRRSPLQHRRHEILFAPPSDSVSGIG
jgi:hypothetical protein